MAVPKTKYGAGKLDLERFTFSGLSFPLAKNHSLSIRYCTVLHLQEVLTFERLDFNVIQLPVNWLCRSVNKRLG